MKSKHIGYRITWLITVILTVSILFPRKDMHQKFVRYLATHFSGVANRFEVYSYVLIATIAVILILLISVLIWTTKLKGKMNMRSYQVSKYILVGLVSIVAFNVFTFSYNYFFIFRGLNKTPTGVDSVRVK